MEQILVPARDTSADTLPFSFGGSGREYFGIWIVNLLLTLVTLGIYSAWAKVRRLQYFYRHTAVAGSSFDYHAKPWSILKGRLIAFALLVAYQGAARTSPRLYLLVLILLALLAPLLLYNAQRFRLHYSSWRGIRFGFDGSLGRAYAVVLGWGLLSLVTLTLLAPLFRANLKRWQHGRARLGSARFEFDAEDLPFFAIYWKTLGLGLLVLTASIGWALVVASPLAHLMNLSGPRGAFNAGVVAGYLIFLLGMWLLVLPFSNARYGNLIWSHTLLAGRRLGCRLSAQRLAALYATNLLGIVLTLGLFTPWAVIRVLRYRIDCLSLEGTGGLDDIQALAGGEVGALGMEALGVFDFDLGF
ncbi:MAG: DUF898 domain-containing protein [Gammaproteobacteria bacterium]|nr:DUF898 domain-containing protein [Gammaproteobacteria bacterium]